VIEFPNDLEIVIEQECGLLPEMRALPGLLAPSCRSPGADLALVTTT
jgi:hypothetical protein